MPATTFIGHFLGPDTHANRPAAASVPNGALYVCTTHNKIERVVSGAWADWANLAAPVPAAAPVFVQKLASAGPASLTSSFTPTFPSGLVTGNLLVLTVVCGSNGATPMSLNTPSGWTLAVDGSAGTFGFGSAPERLYVFVKKIAGGETAPLITSTGGSGYWVALTEEYSGQDPTTPLDGTASAAAFSSGASVAAPAITTRVPNSLLVYIYADMQGTSNTVTPPAGSTTRHNAFDATTDTRITASDLVQAAAATVAATSFTRTATSATAKAATLAIKAPPPT